jgi:hypothetical protein
LVDPVFTEKSLVLCIIWLKLNEVMELKGGVIFHFLGDSNSAPKPSPADIKVGFISVDSPNGEGVFFE